MQQNVRKADELRAIVTWNWPAYAFAASINAVFGSYAVFSGNVGWAFANLAPELLALPLFWLLVLRSQSVGLKYFRYEWEHLNSFEEFVLTSGKDRTEYREMMANKITKKFKCDNLAILLWAIASLSVHIGLILTNPKGRAESKTYVVDAGVSALINSIVVTYYVTRIMQQILTNFITADILAEWGVKDKRDSVDEAETRAYKAVCEVCQSPELNEANDSKHRRVHLWDQKGEILREFRKDLEKNIRQQMDAPQIKGQLENASNLIRRISQYGQAARDQAKAEDPHVNPRFLGGGDTTAMRITYAASLRRALVACEERWNMFFYRPNSCRTC